MNTPIDSGNMISLLSREWVSRTGGSASLVTVGMFNLISNI